MKHQINDAEFQRHKRLFFEMVAPDARNPDHIIYTGKHTITVPRQNITYPKMDANPRQYFCDMTSMRYGFLRAITDKSGNMLAYTRAMPLCRNMFSDSTKRIGTWYVFEEYNARMLDNFEVNVFAWGDERGQCATWQYDANERKYTITFHGSSLSSNWFRVSDNKITTDFDEDMDFTYGYKVAQPTPNGYIVRGVRAALQRGGLIPGTAPLADNFFPHMVMLQELRNNKAK